MTDEDHIVLDLDLTPNGCFELLTALEERAEGLRIEGEDEAADTCLAIAEQAREQVMEQTES